MDHPRFCAIFDSMVARLPDLERILTRIRANSIQKKDL